MLAYAATRRRIAERRSSPNTMLIVACGHIVLLAAVMSAKMDLPDRILNRPIEVISIPIPTPPDPLPTTRPTQATHPTIVDRADVILPTADQPQLDPGPAADPGPITVGGGALIPGFTLPPGPVAVSSAAELLTSGVDLKPPYPQSKLLNEEEASLKLRLTIDDHGRVVAVDPVGSADPVFLSAARRHLLAHWRYKPAIADGRAVATSIVVTLRFQLDG